MGINYALKDATNQSYAALMAVVPIQLPNTPPGLELFQSIAEPFTPIKGIGNVFGGHVLGQAVIAAGLTVPDGFVCHTSSSYFLRPGIPHLPFIYAIERMRDGRIFMTRSIKVFQVEESDLDTFDFSNRFVRFIGILSFKTQQDNPLDFQTTVESALSSVPDHEIIQMPLAPDVDTPMLVSVADALGVEAAWHPIDARKMDTTEFNKGKELSDRRIVHFYRSLFDLPDDPHIHVSLMLYMSDRNSLFTLFNILDDPFVNVRAVASLNHTFTLHQLDSRVDEDYIFMETWSDRAFDRRGLYNGRMFDRNNRLIASFVQDGLVDVLPVKL